MSDQQSFDNTVTPEAIAPQIAEPVSTPDTGFDPNDETFQAFNQQLTQYIGVDAYALKRYVSHVESQVQESTLKPLRDEWGDGFKDNFDLVKARFKELPPQQQAVYDNVDGARFIWQQLQQEAQQQQVAQNVPTFDRGKAVAPSGRFKYTQSGITSMSKADYKADVGNIQSAYAQGLVDLNN